MGILKNLQVRSGIDVDSLSNFSNSVNITGTVNTSFLTVTSNAVFNQTIAFGPVGQISLPFVNITNNAITVGNTVIATTGVNISGTLQISGGITGTITNANNSTYLGGQPIGYFYPASNPNGYLNSSLFSSYPQFLTGSGVLITDNYPIQAGIKIQNPSTTVGDAIMLFECANRSALYFGMSPNGNFYIGTNSLKYSVWTGRNQGAGTGMDADLLDGQHGSYYYAASNPSGFLTVSGTINNANNSTNLNGQPASYYYPASNPSGFITASGTILNANNSANLAGQPGSYYYPASNPSGFLTISGTINSANNSTNLAGQPGSYYYPASNPSGFITASATVANANALNGQPASYYYPASNPNSYITSSATVANANALNGQPASYYYPTSNPSGFITTSATVANANALGGQAPSYYYPASNPSGFITAGGDISHNSLGIGTGASGTAGEIRATNNITSYYSDKRLKKEIKIIPQALNKVLSLSGVTYRSNEVASKYGYKDKQLQVGVIAQEVQAVLPQAVALAPFDSSWDKENKRFISESGENYLTVQYEKLVPLLIEAIKELTEKVRILEEKA